jgi:8-oxo-dGTP diphosphatase
MIDCKFENGNKANLRHGVVDTIVIKDGKILLALRGDGVPEPGTWCLPGGYMDRDETTAQAAAREVLEETGWKVKNMKLFRIADNPDRVGEDRQNIGFVYLAEAEAEVGTKDWETAEVRWFDLDNLPPENLLTYDHGHNIQLYKKYIRSPFDLPYIGKVVID